MMGFGKKRGIFLFLVLVFLSLSSWVYAEKCADDHCFDLDLGWGVAFKDVDRQASCLSIPDFLWFSSVIVSRGYN